MASQEVVIGANGFAESEKALRTMSKYLEQVQKRMEKLSRLHVAPVVRILDLASGPLKRLYSKLSGFANKAWTTQLRMESNIDPSLFSDAGTGAGSTFLNAFLAAFDATKIADKAKSSLDGIAVNVKIEGGGGGGSGGAGKSGKWWTDDDTKSIITGAIGGALGNGLSKLSGHLTGKAVRSIKNRKIRKDASADEPTEKARKTSPPTNEADPLKDKTGEKLAKPKRSPTAFFKNVKDRISKGVPFFNKKNSGEGEPIQERMSIRSRFKTLKEKVVKKIPGLSKKSDALESAAEKLPAESKLKGSFVSRSVKAIGKYFKGGPPSMGVAAPLGKSVLGRGAEIAKNINKLPAKSLGISLLKGAGKVARPLGLLMSAATIANAKPGAERNEAIRGVVGQAAGSAIGGAIGSLILPGIGSMAGAAIGGYVGDKVARGWLGKKVAGLFSRKPKKKEPGIPPFPTGTVAPIQALPVPERIEKKEQKPITPFNINFPVGAVQLTVQKPDLDYDAIAAHIGTQLSVSIRQALENRP